MSIGTGVNPGTHAPAERKISGKHNATFRSAGARKLFLNQNRPINIWSLRDGSGIE